MRSRVSVIVPTKNREDIICRAIDSIIKQDYDDLEIIVVNDGSTDRTIHLIEKKYPTVILINNPTSVGGAIARNIGVKVATGDYIAFLDSDDEWLPNHLINKISILRNLGVDGVYGTFYISDNFETKEIKFHNKFPSDFSIADKISAFQLHDARTSTFVFKKDKFDLIQFDEKLKKHQDWDLAINFSEKFRLALDLDPTIIIHVDSVHSRMSNSLNHVSTLYFLTKNSKSFKPHSLFVFCLKMIMRCQSLNDKSSINLYLDFISKIRLKLALKDQFVFFLVKNNYLNLTLLRDLKKYTIGRLR